MSWDPNAGASNYDDGYGNYGNYNEQPQQFAASDAGTNAPESSYDMFAGNSGYGSGGVAQQSSFYNPNDFSANQGGGGGSGGNDSAYYPGAPQTQQAFQQPGPTNAYRR